MVEVTETILMKSAEHSIAVLRELKERGVGISMDDFGTGYSSLSYLRLLPIDELKIDRSFIQDVSGPREDSTIIAAIVALANSLGLRVVVEQP